MGANGAIGENHANIYARLYQAAGEKWARAGAASHAVCLYAHDDEAQVQFFRYGFGMRTVDAIRGMDEIDAPVCEGYEFAELTRDEYPSILQLNRMLVEHCGQSPAFMRYTWLSDSVLLEKVLQSNSRYFVAKRDGNIISYVKITDDGENFACSSPDMQNICGAYCLPEHRGKNVYKKLINNLIHTLKAENYARIGVDFESFNPTAWGFWLKYFTAYTYGVVRRIDEAAVNRAE
jgi:ribosomal protein S18 acetylase RimI-like enzyme